MKFALRSCLVGQNPPLPPSKPTTKSPSQIGLEIDTGRYQADISTYLSASFSCCKFTDMSSTTPTVGPSLSTASSSLHIHSTPPAASAAPSTSSSSSAASSSSPPSSGSGRPIIAVDMDEVLCGFVPAVVRFHNDTYGTSLKVEDFFSYTFFYVWGGTMEEAHLKLELFHESKYFLEELAPIPHAQNAVRALAEKYDLHVVTSRRYNIETATRQWLEQHFPNCFKGVHFGNHYCMPGQKSIPKSELCRTIGAHLLVDDNLDYAIDCSNNGTPVVLFGDYPWNRGHINTSRPELVVKTPDWDQIPGAIDRILKGQFTSSSTSTSTTTTHSSAASASGFSSPDSSDSTNGRKPIVAVDIDEVLASLADAIVRFSNDTYGTNLAVENITVMNYQGMLGISSREEIEKRIDAFYNSPYFTERQLPVDAEACSYLRQLKEKYELHIVTARNSKVEMLTRTWISKHYPGIFSDFHFGNQFMTAEEAAERLARGALHIAKKRSKSEICQTIGARLLIDDHFDYAIDCAMHNIPVILFGNYSWNRGMIDPEHAGYITRLSRWSEINAAVDQILEGGAHAANSRFLRTEYRDHDLAPSSKGAKRIIAVDIDEVLASFSASVVAFVNDKYNANMSVSDICSLRFDQLWNVSVEETNRRMDEFHDSVYFREQLSPVDEAAFHFLGVLKEKFELHVVTARKSKIENITRDWIETHYPNIFTDIHFGNHYISPEEIEESMAKGEVRHATKRSKSAICKEIGACLLIDDHLEYAIDCAEQKIPAILFGNYSWNRGVINPEHSAYITRVSKWAEVPDAIDRILDHESKNIEALRKPVKIAAIQMCSTHSKASNRAAYTRLIEEASNNGACLVCLPEGCVFMGKDSAETVGAAEEVDWNAVNHPLAASDFLQMMRGESTNTSSVQTFRYLAVKFNIWISVGGMHELRSDLGSNKISNTHFVVAPDGSVRAHYRKVNTILYYIYA